MTEKRTLSTAVIDGLVDRLEHARRTKQQIRQLSLDHPTMTVDDAYAIQQAWVERQIVAGDRIIGHKIGLTSRAMQRAVNIEEPDYGVLLASMIYEPDSVVPHEDFVEPRVEVELAYVLAGRVRGPDVTAGEVLAATSYVVPAVEIIDARVQRIDPDSGRTRSVRDTIADNAANAGIVLGTDRFDPKTLDLPWLGAVLRQNGRVEETGLAAGVLGDPTEGVAWLARTYATHGRSLDAGQVVLAGSFTRPVFAQPGDEFSCDFGELGSFRVEFR